MKNIDKFIEGRHVNLRKATLEDAQFILSLRQQAQHMMPVANDVAKQRQWMAEHDKPGNYYFIIMDKMNIPYGTIRLHDGSSESFWGASWILKNGLPFYAAMESFYLFFDAGFTCFGAPKAFIKAAKENQSIMRFYKRMNTTLISEDNDFAFLTLTKEAFYQYFAKIGQKRIG